LTVNGGKPEELHGQNVRPDFSWHGRPGHDSRIWTPTNARSQAITASARMFPSRRNMKPLFVRVFRILCGRREYGRLRDYSSSHPGNRALHLWLYFWGESCAAKPPLGYPLSGVLPVREASMTRQSSHQQAISANALNIASMASVVMPILLGSPMLNTTKPPSRVDQLLTS